MDQRRDNFRRLALGSTALACLFLFVAPDVSFWLMLVAAGLLLHGETHYAGYLSGVWHGLHWGRERWATPATPAPVISSGAAVANVVQQDMPKEVVRLLEHIEQNPLRPDGSLRLFLGRTLAGKRVEKSLSEVNHLLVGGLPRSGKSVQVESIMYQLLMTELDPKSRGSIQLALADITGVTFNPPLWESLPILLGGKVAEDNEGVDELLKKVVAVAKERETLFRQYPAVARLDEYNAVAKEKLPYLVVIIEEGAATVEALGKKFKSDLMQALFKVPKYGIYFILLTQRLTIDTLGPGRDAFTSMLWFRMIRKNIRPLLEIPDELDISEDVKGRAVYRFAGETGEMQGAFVEKEKLLELLQLVKEARHG
jgi:DNA segregation ATPase FtsK/SpoIIIE-like protein